MERRSYYKTKPMKLINMVRDSLDLETTLEFFKIDISTFNKWLNEDEWFRNEIKTLDQALMIHIQSILTGEINSGNLKAIELYIKYREHFSILPTKGQDIKTKDDLGSIIEKMVEKISNKNINIID